MEVTIMPVRSKQVIIKRNQLPKVDEDTPHKQIRIRLLTEDKNRSSSWSPIFSIDPEMYFICGTKEISGTIKLEKVSGQYVSAVWDAVSIYKKASSGDEVNIGNIEDFDVWIRWAGTSGSNPSDWIYLQRITSSSLNIIIPTTYSYGAGPSSATPKYLYVEVYRTSRTPSRYQKSLDFNQDASNVIISDDNINFSSGHEYTTGSAIVYTSTNPITGLISGSTYYVRAITYKLISLHDTAAHAVDNTNKINLSGTPTGVGTITGYPFLMYSSLITTL